MQLIQTAACSQFHIIQERLAHWMLMVRDRARSDQFHVTHEGAADILGVRRSGITQAAISLQKRKLIRYHRGVVTILNAPALEVAACKCYATLTQTYAQTMNSQRGIPPIECVPGIVVQL
jgi:predicted transcriptional regulator of viral defense system